MNKHVIQLSVVAFLVGYAADSVHAAVTTGSLRFSDGSDDWFSELTPGVGDVFDIEFNPFDLNFVTTQTGDFTPPFDGSPVQGVASSIGSFLFVSEVGSTFTYELVSDLVFAYDNGATVTWAAGSQAEGAFNGPDSVQFDFLPGSVAVAGIGIDVAVTSSSLQFSDTAAPGGGTYNAGVDVTSDLSVVPEPSFAIGLGLLAAFAFGRRAH